MIPYVLQEPVQGDESSCPADPSAARVTNSTLLRQCFYIVENGLVISKKTQVGSLRKTKTELLIFSTELPF